MSTFVAPPLAGRALANFVAGCAGKLPYPTLREAKTALRQMRGKHRASGCCHAYRCDFCGGYHLGRDRVRRGPLPVRGEFYVGDEECLDA